MGEQRRRNKLRQKIDRCYRDYRQLSEKYHHLFQHSVEKLCTTRSPHYLKKWIETYHCYVEKSRKEQFGEAVGSEDEKSSGTFDTEDVDMEEYLVDLYDGMDMPEIQIEEGIGIGIDRAQQGIKQTTQGTEEKGNVGEPISLEATCGNVELNKRKPPDGSEGTNDKSPLLARCDTA